MTGERPGTGDEPRIAILGGGIGGIAAAAFLRLAGLRATVYEQASQLREVGAGVVVAPNAVRLLRALGVLGAFEERAVPLDTGWEFRRWRDGLVLSAEDLATECERRYGERTYTAHPMFPFFGQGAAQAIEDAATLARCLAADPADPAAALRRYEELRIPRTTRLQQVSHARAHVNHLPDGPEQEARDAGFSTTDALAASGWIYAHDACAAP